MSTKYLVWIFVASIPFSFALNPTAGIDLSLTRIFVPLLFLFWLASSLKTKVFLIDKRARFWLLMGFVALSTFSFFWSIDQSRAIRKILFLLSLVPLYFVSYSFFQTKERQLRLFKVLSWSGLFVSVFSLGMFILQFVFGINFALDFASKFIAPVFLGNTFSDIVAAFPSWMVDVEGKTILRTFGTFPDPHLFSLYVNMLLPLVFYLFFTEKKKLYLAIGAIILVASLLAFSRAAYLSLIFGLLFLFLSNNPLRQIKRSALPVLLLIVTLFYLIVLPNPLTQRLGSSFNVKEGSNKGRVEMWQKGLETIREYPATGVGIGNFSRHIQPTSDLRDPIYAHNLFLDFASETGLLGMFLVLCVIFSPIISSFRSPTLLKKIIATSFIIFLIHSFFETPIYSIRVFPLLLILLSIKTDDK